MKKLYKFNFDNIESVFIEDEENVTDSIGQVFNITDSYTDERIFGILYQDNFTELLVSEDTINYLIDVLGNVICGINPLDYIENK